MSTTTGITSDLLDFWLAEAEHPFSGWDFSHILDTGRMRSAPLAWSYTSELLPRIRRARTLLDMGTGGGEYLSLLQPLPSRTFATESYGPNVPVARARLEPLGVEVRTFSEDEHLPFDDDAFDLVINRHESYAPAEVLRILRPGGEFVTQQVGGENDWDLNTLLGARPDLAGNEWRAKKAARALKTAGFEVIKIREAFPHERFFDVGAIVYYLKAIPWQVPDFSVERYFDALLHIHGRIERDGYLDVRAHRFMLVARKPGP